MRRVVGLQRELPANEYGWKHWQSREFWCIFFLRSARFLREQPRRAVRFGTPHRAQGRGAPVAWVTGSEISSGDAVNR